jgi:PAT family beta-lactamase induction signal transducer AmpG
VSTPETPPAASPASRRARELGWTTSAYFGEGLPYAILHMLVTEFLTAIGAPASEVGYTSWFHVPVTAKPLLSPIVDLVGSKRSWTIAMQLLIAAGIGGLALWLGPDTGPSGMSPPSWLGFWLVLGVVAVLHSMHDIACDGFYMLALDTRGQALYSGTRQAAFRAAMYVGGAALVLVASPDATLFGSTVGGLVEPGRSHWQLAFLIAAALLGVTGLTNALALPHIVEPHATKKDGTREPFWATYGAFFAQPGIALLFAFALTYRLGDTMTSSMSSVLLRDLGLSTGDRGILRSFSLTTSMLGSIAAGALLARGGLERWLVPFTWVMAIPWYLVVALVHPPFWVIAIAVVLEQLAGSLAGTASTVLLMRRSRRAFSASHYAFFTALVSLGSTMSGGFSGHLYERVGAVPYFALTVIASLPALVLVRKVPLDVVDAPRAGA